MLSAITRSPHYKWWAFGAIAIGTFAAVTDQGSVNVALPSIASHFSTDIPSVQWVVIGYALTISALLMPMGHLADLVGRKNVYIAGSLVLILGASIAGSSPNLVVLVLSRLLQGAGAAMTQGTSMAITIDAFPSNERGKAIGSIMTIVGTGAVVGPAVGGVLVDALGWRSVFLANIPMVLLGVTAGMTVLVQDNRGKDQPSLPSPPAARLLASTAGGPGGGPARHRASFDWWGAALSTGALVLFLLAITNGHRFGWYTPPILVGAAGFVVLSAAFIWWELRCPNPLFELRFFRRPTFSFGVLAGFMIFVGSSSVLFLTPFYLQRVMGYSPREAGLIVIPGAICMALLGPISGRLSDRYGWRTFTIGGLALSAIGLFILSYSNEASSLFQVMPALMLMSSGMGIFYSPNSSSILSAVERERYGVVSGFLNLVRNAGNVTSVAFATAIVTATMGAMGYAPTLEAVQVGGAAGVGAAFVTGLRNAYLTMAGLMVVAMVVSAFKFAPTQGLQPAASPETSRAG